MAIAVTLSTGPAWSSGELEVHVDIDGRGTPATAFVDAEVLASSTPLVDVGDAAAVVGEMPVEGTIGVLVETPTGESGHASRAFSCSLGELLAGGTAACGATGADERLTDAAAELATALGSEFWGVEYSREALAACLAGFAEGE